MNNATSKAVPAYETVSIFGVPVAKMDMRETVQYLTQVIAEREPHQVITANPIMIMSALDQPEYHAMMKRAELIIPDGAGVVWAAGYVGNPVKERVAGYDLMHELMREGEARQWRVYLLGTTQEIIEASAQRLKQEYLGITICGYRDGFFGEAEDEQVIETIREAKPDILLVGRSAATQEPWIDRYKNILQVPVIIGVGGSFDVLSGKLKRAPKLWQRMRLEWLYRLLQEPYRYKRMLVLPKFVWKVIRERDKVQKVE